MQMDVALCAQISAQLEAEIGATLAGKLTL
jgi:hypothetical protein